MTSFTNQDESSIVSPLTVSVVAPMKDESQTVEEFVNRTLHVFEQLEPKYCCELIIIDDGSSDQTFTQVMDLQEKNSGISVVKLSRNFGLESALKAGISKAQGDLVVTMDTDLQDPPELIIELVHRFEKGAQIVSCIRSDRPGDSFFKRAAARSFYRLLSALSGGEYPSTDVANFRLIGPLALVALREITKNECPLRVQIPYLGFEEVQLGYRREPRLGGSTKYSLKKQFDFAREVITYSSHKPLSVGLYALLSFLVFLSISMVGFFSATDSGRMFLSLGLIVLGQLLLLTVLSVFGMYLGWMHKNLEKKPPYIVEYMNLASLERRA